MARKKAVADEIAAEVVEVSTNETGTKEIIIERKNEETAEQKQEELNIAQKLLSLYNLQQVDSQIDRIVVERGELPNEVRDLEDAIEGLKTRIANYEQDIKEIHSKLLAETAKIEEAQALIKRYEEQQQNVRNNREYESLTKEIEYQNLEIQLAEKNKGKCQAAIDEKNMAIKGGKVIKENRDGEKEEKVVKGFEEQVNELNEILVQKQSELEGILAETEEKEKALRAQADVYKEKIEPRLLAAFERIRKNARNGLAIVQIERDACGGCFSTIPPQRQLDIRLHKKIIVCEACGRIFIDKQLVEDQKKQLEGEQEAQPAEEK